VFELTLRIIPLSVVKHLLLVLYVCFGSAPFILNEDNCLLMTFKRKRIERANDAESLISSCG